MRTEPAPAESAQMTRFETVRVLGGGGRVRLVRDLRHGGALRVLKTARVVEADDPRAPGAHRDVLHEARELASLRHPGVPRPFETGVWEDGRPWLLLEYVQPAPGEPERDAAPRAAPVAVARGLLDVLGYLHRHGRLHNDVKPGNVIAAADGRIVLVDFGLATREDEPIPPRGTLPYVAPEVLAGERADRRSDIWAAAAVLLRLELGREIPPNASISPDDVPHGGALPSEWLRRLLHGKPDRRFATAEAALAELDAELGASPKPFPRRPLPHAISPAGRGAEVAELVRRLDEAREGAVPTGGDAAVAGTAGLVLVRGESGVGKSRLIAELRLLAAERGWTAFAASCADERGAALPALATVLDAALAEAPVGSQAVRRRGKAVATLSAARGDHDASESAARFLTECAAEGRCVLVVVEDLQHANAASVRVLAAIARVVAEAHAFGTPPRLVAVATLTDGVPLSDEIAEALAGVVAEGIVAQMPLRPLAPADVADLVRGVLGPRAPAERIGEILHAHGGALPLFAEEMLARLFEDGALRHESGRWVLDTRHAPQLPANLTSAVTARLAALPPAELRAVQVVAAHELPMPLDRARKLLGASFDEVSASLEARGLTVPTRDGARVALVHAAIAQAALAMLAPGERARLHDEIGEAIPRVDPASAMLRAYHVARGADPDAAVHAATEAARELRAEGEPGRAAEFVRQALRRLSERDPRIPYLRRSLAELLVSSRSPEAAANVYRDLLDAETDRGARVRLLLGLAEALDAAGRAPEVLRACRTALDLMPAAGKGDADPDVRLSLLARLAGAQRATGELRGAIESVKQALPLAVAGRASERVVLLSLLGNVNLQMGDMARARQFHESCLAACRSLGRRRVMAASLHNMGVVEARSGRRDDALRYYHQALRIARRAKDLVGVAETLGNIANLRAEAGDFTAAERLQRRSLAIRRRSGDLAGTAVTLGNMAGLLRAKGRLGRSLELAQTAIRRLRALEDAHGEVQFLLLAASVHLAAGDLAGARPLLARALDRARSSSLRVLEARAETLWGRLERRADPHDDEWSKRLTRAVALSEHVGDRAGTVEALLETALGERDRGRRGSAMRAWRLAHALLEQGGGADLAARADLVRARIDSDRGSPEALAAAVRFHAYSLASGRRDYQAAAAFALARARLRSGDRDGAAAALREAVEVEDDLSASLPPALRRVRESGPSGGLFRALREEIEAGSGPSAARDGTPFAATSEDEMDQERLLKLLEINKQLNQAQDMRALLDTIMDVATTTTGAERGFLILVDDGKITFQTARNFRREEVKKPELKISSSLVRRVMKSGSPILTDNATEDERFAEFQSVERLELKSIVSVPFRSGDAVIGAMYLDNPARKGAFGPGDLQFLQALSDQAAIAIRNLRHANEMAELNRQLEKNLERKSVQLEVASRALAGRATKHPYDEIIGESPQLREVLLLVDKVVDTDVPVLIQGESGTGKELVARAIHRFGRRRDGPFVPVNCGAITETLMESELFGHAKGSFTGAVADKKGLFETADGGTIFLDEIGEMSVDMQKKLLRVLQERELRPVGGKGAVKVDVRVISATNKNLRQMMQEGRFREDLYYRIAVINVDMPPLRERRGDVPLLVDFFVKKASRDLGLVEKPIDAAAMSALVAYSWPGNVRELDNEVKKALTLSEDRITIDDLSEQIQTDHPGEEPELVAADAGKTLKESLEKTEKALIEKALEKTGGNQTRAAKELGISRVWLRKKMEKYGLFAVK
jgi:transcriptional regulator with GAF, ATPase, and Fis domain/tetratricopeptide (TPR) repeat protein